MATFELYMKSYMISTQTLGDGNAVIIHGCLKYEIFSKLPGLENMFDYR